MDEQTKFRTDRARDDVVRPGRSPLTVLQVLPALEGGGVERGVLEIAKGLVEAGHRSLVASSGGRMVRSLEADGSRHFECAGGVKSPRCAFAIAQLRNLIIRERVDVVDVHSRLPAWVTWMAVKTLPAHLRPRLISTFHGFYSVGRYSRIMGSGDVVISVSESVQRYAQTSWPELDRSRMRVVPRGICMDEFPRGFTPTADWVSQLYRDFPSAVGKILLLLPGRVTRLKGHLEFLNLVSELRRVGLRVHGLIVGGIDPRKRSYADEVIARQHALGLAKDITWTGHRSDMREFYAVSDLVLSLSQQPEAFGRTVAESLSLGTPVAGWDHGGASEVLARQFPEGRVPPGDVSALLKQVQWLLENRSSIAIGENPFSLADMINRTLEVYSEVVDGIGRRAA
ncbi:MAG: glycosyltransferase [Planctomyces sp.]|nr:glycosyltransferase [Planctomyces sp.]